MDAAHAAGVERLLFLGSAASIRSSRSSRFESRACSPARLSRRTTRTRSPRSLESCRCRRIGASTASGGSRPCRRTCTGPATTSTRENSHVLPALIRRFHEAGWSGADRRGAVGEWDAAPGVPARRRFGRATVCLLDVYDEPEPINVGIGKDVTVRELAELVADVVGWLRGGSFDTREPDGTPRKLLDVVASCASWGGSRRSRCATGSPMPTGGSSTVRRPSRGSDGRFSRGITT